MDLRCPHCVQQVSIPSERAGEVVACPLCGKPFAAPALSPMPSLAPPPAPPPPPPAPAEAVNPVPPPAPPPPPGEYTHHMTLRLRPEVVACLVPACLGAIFVLSFMAWYQVAILVGVEAFNLWQLAFTGAGSWLFTGYTVLVLLALPLSVVLAALSLRLIPLPSAVGDLIPFGWVVLAALLLLAAVLLGLDYLARTFATVPNPIAPAMKLAARLHLLALVASGVQFWLARRVQRNLPPPAIEVRT